MKRFFSLTTFVVVALLTACGSSEKATTPVTESTEAESTEAESITYDFGDIGILDFPPLPDTYSDVADKQGTVETVYYNNGTEDKYYNIYLPYGYETSGQTYNVLYLMHGGGGGPENFITPEKVTAVQTTFDYMIQDGVSDPFIVVAPSWNPNEVSGETEASGGNSDSDYNAESDATTIFAKNELSQYVIASVDSKYRTIADRNHRAFSGFSMGGVTTWNVFQYDLKDFAYIIPLSGDCWTIEQTGGKTKPDETVAALEASVAAQGFTGEHFTIYCATGSIDLALPNLAPQILAMQKSDLFEFGVNTFFGVSEGTPHADPLSKIYLYTILPLIWK